jgi:hypothetical protein
MRHAFIVSYDIADPRRLRNSRMLDTISVVTRPRPH